MLSSTGLQLVPQQERQCYSRGISNSVATVVEVYILEGTALRAALNLCQHLLQLLEPNHLEKTFLQVHTWWRLRSNNSWKGTHQAQAPKANSTSRPPAGPAITSSRPLLAHPGPSSRCQGFFCEAPVPDLHSKASSFIFPWQHPIILIVFSS